MQPFAVMPVRLVDMSRQVLRQGVYRRHVIDVLSLDKTRNAAPVVYHLRPAE